MRELDALSAKVGDIVYYRSSKFMAMPVKTKIAKMTSRTITTEDGKVFNIADGSLWGSGKSFYTDERIRLRYWNEEYGDTLIRECMEYNQKKWLAIHLAQSDFMILSVEELNAIAKMFAEAKNERQI